MRNQPRPTFPLASPGVAGCFLGIAAIMAAAHVSAAEPSKVRVFILSGQSNMAGLDPNISFTPAVKKAFLPTRQFCCENVPRRHVKDR